MLFLADRLLEIRANRVVGVRLHPRLDDARVEIRERLRALENRRVERFLRQGKRAGGDGRQTLGRLDSPIQQHAGGTFLIDQPQCLGFIDLNGPGRKHQVTQRRVGNASGHNLQRQRGEGDADPNSGTPMRPVPSTMMR